MLVSKGKGRIVAEDEIEVEDVAVEAPAEDVVVEPEASDLLFEAEDVAELLAEVTGDVVVATAEEDVVTFAIGEGETVEEYTVTAEGDEEILEASTRMRKGARPVKASRRPMARRPISASARKPMARRPVSASRKAMPARKPAVKASAKVDKTPVKASKTIRKVPSAKKVTE